MANVLGIIAEYNPFHNGHLYHLQQSKKLTNSDYTICIMSGNFVQRGDTSLLDKWTKTQMALENGIDLVIELPTLYATSSSENFALGAIKILNELKIVDFISFGFENCEIEVLNNIANVLYEEPKQFTSILSHELSKGISFPKARENALLMYLNNIQKYSNVINQPNNILGIEYLKALKKTKSTIIPMAIKREKVYYNSHNVVDEYASSTAIRQLLKHEAYDEIRCVMPDNSYLLMRNEIDRGNYITTLQTFEKEIFYKLRTMKTSEIANLPDVSEGLEFAIKNASNNCNNLYDLISAIKSKRYTQTRIQRILVYCLLGITKHDMEISKKVTPYIRVLGCNEKGKRMLSAISNRNKKVQLITSVKRYLEESKNTNLKLMLEKDIQATNIYTLGFQYKSQANLDYTKKLIIK